MVRNIVVLGGNSHPHFTDRVCEILGVAPCNRILEKFSGGESRCEIKDSVRGKDVYIIQSFGCGSDSDRVNDHFVELCIMISACKMGSAKRVTAILPMFPYSRQPDVRYNKAGAPLSKMMSETKGAYTFESVPVTPGPGSIVEFMSRASLNGGTNPSGPASVASSRELSMDFFPPSPPQQPTYTTHNYENPALVKGFESKPGYKHWVAQAGTLVADLLTCAGADRVLTCDLHESTYQGFFDIPGMSMIATLLSNLPKRDWLHLYAPADTFAPCSRQSLRQTPSAALHPEEDR